ncbi:hypothetical protein XH98_20620 [Bradyrhizobium sp. CCBAU 51745]|nr:hypothetical protein [Bradyrhizobium sp. CCBAU 51745]
MHRHHQLIAWRLQRLLAAKPRLGRFIKVAILDIQVGKTSIFRFNETLMEAWAYIHASTSNPDSRLYPKATGREAKLCYMGHALENRHGLAVGGKGHACQWYRRTPSFGGDAEGETQSRRPSHHGR